MPLDAPFERLHDPTLMPRLLQRFSIVIPTIKHHISPEHWKPSHWAVISEGTDTTVLVLLCLHYGQPCAFVLDLAESCVYQVKMRAPKSFFIGTVFMAEVRLAPPPVTFFSLAFLYAQGSVLHVGNMRNIEITSTLIGHLWIDGCIFCSLPLRAGDEDVGARCEATTKGNTQRTTLLEIHVFPWYRCLCVQRSAGGSQSTHVVLNGGRRHISQAARCNRVNTTRP